MVDARNAKTIVSMKFFHMNVVNLKDRMDTRVGAFGSHMSQHSQEFLFVLIAPLENFSQPL